MTLLLLALADAVYAHRCFGPDSVEAVVTAAWFGCVWLWERGGRDG